MQLVRYLFYCMICLWLSLYLSSSLYVNIILFLLFALLFSISIVIKNRIFIKTSDVFINVDTETLLQSFQDSDIIFTGEHEPILNSFDFYFLHYSIPHSGIIKKENGILYIYHSHAYNYYDPTQVLYEYTYRAMTWRVVRQTLIDYILSYQKSCFQIFRGHKKIRITQSMIQETSDYCNQFVGNILLHNRICTNVDKGGNIVPFQHEYIINRLQSIGYKCLYLRHI